MKIKYLYLEKKNKVMLLLTLVYTWVLCCFNSNYKSELSHVECIIQADPESALKEIRCIDKNSLLRKKDYALYSLLLSMALDKALEEYRKFQVKTLSPVEQAYLESIKLIEKKAKGKNKSDSNHTT